jgi:hypothetical protein
LPRSICQINEYILAILCNVEYTTPCSTVTALSVFFEQEWVLTELDPQAMCDCVSKHVLKRPFCFFLATIVTAGRSMGTYDNHGQYNTQAYPGLRWL